ncbi:UNVERIFIED_CONTAM: hypothetical protein K2H54_022202 [Gekko kuhli]
MNLLLEIPLFLLIVLYSYLEALVKLLIPAKRKSVTGEIVLITGAGHGLGRSTAYEFAKHHCQLVLWDINKHGIEETAAQCRKLGARAHAFVVDCSKKEEIYCMAEKVKRETGDVSILMNNAGVISTTDLLSTGDHEIQKIFEVNILAHHWISKAFLPAMMKNNHGHIVTVASAVGHIVAPFIEVFGSPLSVCGWALMILIPSQWFQIRLMPPLEPEQVAKQVMERILANQRMIFIPPLLKVSVMLDRLLPARAIPALWRLNDLKFDVVVAYKDKEN